MAKPRKVAGLRWAEWTSCPPFAAAPRRRTGPQKAGLAFQRNATRALAHLGTALHAGPWIRFEDRNGPGFAQPDILLAGTSTFLVLECKLKFTPSAILQLDALYRPLLEALVPSTPIRRAVLCKYLTPQAKALIPRPALEVWWDDIPHSGSCAILSWNGQGRLFPDGDT